MDSNTRSSRSLREKHRKARKEEKQERCSRSRRRKAQGLILVRWICVDPWSFALQWLIWTPPPPEEVNHRITETHSVRLI
jgi:hypothetical protein